MWQRALTGVALLLWLGPWQAAARSIDSRHRSQGRVEAPGRERWHERDRSAPFRERQWIRQRMDGVKVTASMLVNVRGQVAGADHIKPVRGRKDDERWLVSREVAAALAELRVEVKQELGPEYDVWLNGAFDSNGRMRGRQSMHSRGCAVDLDLYIAGEDGRRGHKANGKIDELAPIVARVFTRQVDASGRSLRGWVLHEGNHVHASLESPSVGGTIPEDATPPDRRHGPTS